MNAEKVLTRDFRKDLRFYLDRIRAGEVFEVRGVKIGSVDIVEAGFESRLERLEQMVKNYS